MVRLRVDQGQGTAAYTRRGREFFGKAAREGIELADVARGYLISRGARLGPAHKALVLAAAGQSFVEKNISQALRSTLPPSMASAKEFVHLTDEQCDWQEGEETWAMSTGQDEEEIDALVTEL